MTEAEALARAEAEVAEVQGITVDELRRRFLKTEVHQRLLETVINFVAGRYTSKVNELYVDFLTALMERDWAKFDQAKAALDEEIRLGRLYDPDFPNFPDEESA